MLISRQKIDGEASRRPLAARISVPATTAGPRRRGSIGFELVLGMVIIVLAVWLAVEFIGRRPQRGKAAAFAADLQAIADAHQRVFRPATNAPKPNPATAPAVAAPDPEAALRDTNWARGSPFGGRYEWVFAADTDLAGLARPGSAIPVAVTVTAFSPQPPLTCKHADLVAVDAIIDDGDLATGRFRSGFNGWPVYRFTD